MEFVVNISCMNRDQVIATLRQMRADGLEVAFRFDALAVESTTGRTRRVDRMLGDGWRVADAHEDGRIIQVARECLPEVHALNPDSEKAWITIYPIHPRYLGPGGLFLVGERRDEAHP